MSGGLDAWMFGWLKSECPRGELGGLKEDSFDRSRFKPFTLKYLTESGQTPSCERPKTTAQGTLFLLFEDNKLFELSTWNASFLDFFEHLRHYAANRIQLLFSNNRPPIA